MFVYALRSLLRNQPINRPHEGLAFTAKEFGQEDAGHGPDAGKVEGNDEGGDEAGPEAIERRLGQQEKSLGSEDGEVESHAKTHTLHPQGPTT